MRHIEELPSLDEDCVEQFKDVCQSHATFHNMTRQRIDRQEHLHLLSEDNHQNAGVALPTPEWPLCESDEIVERSAVNQLPILTCPSLRCYSLSDIARAESFVKNDV